ncbi:restriction endonuclease-like protein [Myxococcus stipitatus]|uniref:DUF2357 domain-containing protein n=1 Tax=Myxococcus stipitatus TaxID=83455 RepID=UPI0031452525
MHFRDAKGRHLEGIIQDGVVVLEEDRTYKLALQLSEAAQVECRGWLGELELEWDSASTSFTLRTSYWVGTQSLRIQGPQGEQHLSVEVLPHKNKLQSEAWAHLLRDLDAWMPGTTVGQEGGRHGRVGHQGCDIAGVASVLGDLVPAFEAALTSVLRAPKEQSVELWTEVPIHSVKQADRGTLRWLASHPNTYQGVRGYAESFGTGPVPRVPSRAWQGALDHAANRHVAWLTRQVVLKLRDTVECVERGLQKTQSLDPDLEDWCKGRVRQLVQGAHDLEALLLETPLGAMTPEYASDSAILTFVDDPLYARVHAFGQLFLSPRFQLPTDDAHLSAPVRPSYELYELWTFLALRRLLAELLPDAQWSEDNTDTLRLFDESPHGASYTARWPGHGTLTLHFNLSFPGFLTRERKRSSHWSISKTRRPDLVVTWQPDVGQARWLCLDAKYRTDTRGIADAFESAHIYRDSLRWRDMGEQGRCAGAVLLVPTRLPQTAPWFEKSFRDEHHVGVFCLTPGQSPPTELIEWLRHTLFTTESTAGG